jgi:hypothetical protein
MAMHTQAKTPQIEHLLVFAGLVIKEDAAEYDLKEPFLHGRMWIALTIGERVVLAMAGNPLLSNDTGGQPQPEAHEVRNRGMKHHAFMRGRSMQIQSDAKVCDMAQRYHVQNRDPPGHRSEQTEFQHALLQEEEKARGHSRQAFEDLEMMRGWANDAQGSTFCSSPHLPLCGIRLFLSDS